MEGSAKTPPTPSPSPRELFFGTGPKKRLNQWLATGICGNDITSSCLYVSAIAAVYAGVLAPVVLLMVVGVLYLYKKVYTEVVEALPLNGGTYNALLNCTSKFAAALAACMTILSYIATAVISSKTAAEYLHTVFPAFGVMEGTILILGIFDAEEQIKDIKHSQGSCLISLNPLYLIIAFPIYLSLFISLSICGRFSSSEKK